MLAHRRNDHLGHRDGVHIHMAHDRILRNQKPECHNFLDNVVRKYRDNTLLDAKHEYQNGTLRERSQDMKYRPIVIQAHYLSQFEVSP